MSEQGIKNLDLREIKKIHFIGIGGIMVSAVARAFLEWGKQISGSDRNDSDITKELEKSGVKFYQGHKKENLEPDVNLVIYTIAIDKDNPELKEAQRLGLPALTVYQALGFISEDKYTLTVSGMHGKTTTTALLGLLLIEAKLDPTVFVGSLVKEFKNNVRVGHSQYLVSEACEYKRNFLEFSPNLAILTNLEPEHLDYYKNLDEIIKTFKEFISKIPKKGFIITNGDDKNLEAVIKEAKSKVTKFGISNKDVDFYAHNIQLLPTRTTFKVYSAKNTSLAKKIFTLKIPGLHNIYNALSIIAVAQVLGIDVEVVKKVIENFTGVWRRFEYKGERNEVMVIDDYAHHPTEIKATLLAARQKYSNKKIFVVFQPHLYSRTRLLLNKFAQSFDKADEVIIADIYAAREKDDGLINAENLVGAIKKHNIKVSYQGSFNKIIKYLEKNLKKYSILITIGAGDIYQVGERYLKDKKSKIKNQK